MQEDDDSAARSIVAAVDGDRPLGAEDDGFDASGGGDPHEGAEPHGGDDDSEGGEGHEGEGHEGEAGDDEPPAGFDPADPALTECAGQPMNDIGNGRRLLRRHGPDLRYVLRIGWAVFDGRRFAEDIDGALIRPRAHATSEMIGLEAFVLGPTKAEAEAITAAEAAVGAIEALRMESVALDDEDISATERKRRRVRLSAEIASLRRVVTRGQAAVKRMQGRRAKRRSFGIASGNAGKLDAMIGEAVPARAIALDAFDANAMSFNVLNGTLHFTAVEVEDPDCPDPDVVRLKREWRAELRPHARGDLISKLAPVAWDPEAQCPVFDRFLARILPDDPVQGDALRAFMLRSLGLALTGLTTEQCFWLLYGGGQNGKSTLIDIVAQVLGDYACTVPVMSLVNDQPRAAGQPTPDLNPIAGARFVRSSEPKEGLPLDESLIKGLTGGEPIMLRRLNQEATEVRPKFKLFISVNHKPEIRGDDEGIWRRVRLVPFRVHIPREERDLDLPRKLEAEMPGILRRLVEGLLDYLQNGGLRPPPDVVEATEAYRKGEDDLGSFISAAVDITRRESDEETPGGLYAAYKVWAEREARPVMGKARFTRRLPETAERFGFERVKSSTSLYRGIRVRPEFFTPDRPGAFPSARGDDD